MSLVDLAMLFFAPILLYILSYVFVFMSTQISLKLSDKMFVSAKEYADIHGYDSLQEFIRELLREALFEKETFGGIQTHLASESSLAKDWLSPEEDEAWLHLQKEM